MKPEVELPLSLLVSRRRRLGEMVMVPKGQEDKELLKEAIREVLSELRSELFWPRWLSTKEAIKYSGLSKDVLYNLAKKGEVYATTVGGGKLIWDRHSIDEFFLKSKNEIALKAKRIVSSAMGKRDKK